MQRYPTIHFFVIKTWRRMLQDPAPSCTITTEMIIWKPNNVRIPWILLVKSVHNRVGFWSGGVRHEIFMARWASRINLWNGSFASGQQRVNIGFALVYVLKGTRLAGPGTVPRRAQMGIESLLPFLKFTILLKSPTLKITTDLWQLCVLLVA